jgi:hypothetical protein
MDWSVLSVPIRTAVAGIAIATVTDIRTHEVPDWLSYALIALGLVFAAIHTTITHEWTLLYSLVGLGVGYGIGAALYYTGQWGGGDAKLLMGIGALLTVPVAWVRDVQITPESLFTLDFPFTVPLFMRFLGLLLICGAVYGLLWMVYLMIRYHKKFRTLYPQKMREYRTYRLLAWIATAALIIFSIFMLVHNLVASLLILLLAGLVLGAFHLMVAIRVAEEHFMLKTVKASKLTEGDWVVGGVQIGKEWIIPENNIGATKEQIAVLSRRAPNKDVIVKEGIPFVPSFLAAIILALL